MKMHKNFRALGALFLLMSLLISAFCVTASATPPIDDGENGVQWIYINADHTKLSGDGVTYEKVTLPADCQPLELGEQYIYMNSPRGYATGSEQTRENILSFEKGGYLLYVESSDDHSVTFYCRSDMLADFQSYVKGETGKYVLRSPKFSDGFNVNDKFYDLTDSFAKEILALPQNEKAEKIEVADLKNCEIMELRFHDKSGLLTTLYGAAYLMPNGVWGYVDYTSLDNSYFDADGNFSYRRGEVTIYPMEDFSSKLKQNSDGSYNISIHYTYELYEYEDELGIIGGLGGSDYTEEMAVTAFWVVFVMLGYLVPIAPLVIGLVFARSKKMSHPKRWYAVAGLAVLWMVLAVALTVLLLA